MSPAFRSTALALFFLIVLFASTSVVYAESVQWNYVVQNTLYDPINDPSIYDYFETNTFYNISDPNVTITYNTIVKNADTGAVVPCGSSVPAGTKLQFQFVPHVYTDISWVTTGFAFDTPYGDWVAGAARPYPDMCISRADKDFITSFYYASGFTAWLYTSLSVDPPVKTTSISPLLSCTGASTDMSRTCTAASVGTASNTFNFAPTYGQFYSRLFSNLISQLNSGSDCWTSNGPMDTQIRD